MKIAISGSPRDIEFVKAVCRKKIQSGALKVSPVVSAAVKPAEDDVHKEDEEAVVAADSKESAVVDNKYTGIKDDKTNPPIDSKKRKGNVKS